MEKSEAVRGLFILGFLMVATGFAAETKDSPAVQSYSVGAIPYSNQWEYDRPRSFFLLGASRMQLTSENIKLNNEYNVDLQTQTPFFGTLNYFTELTRLGSTHFSIMGQY